MTPEQFEAEKDYHMASCLVENLYNQGLLKDEEIKQVRKKLIDRYQPIVSSLVGVT